MTKRKTQTHHKVIHHAKKILVPHKGNQYRPHLIRWQGLSVVLALVLVVQASYSFFTTGSLHVLGAASDVSVSELLDQTNVQRQKAELKPLTLNKKLTQAAYLKAKDMFANNYWAHTSPSGVTPWKWYGDVDYQYDIAGENLAKNYPTATATVSAWMASPAHRENILREDYKDVGFAVMEGIIDDKETVVVVAEYGSPILLTPLAPATHAASISESDLPPLTYVGVLVQSLNPASIGVLVLLAIVGIVAAATHHYRSRLPKAWQKSWRIHHGAYKVVGVIVVMALIILGSGGGQI